MFCRYLSCLFLILLLPINAATAAGESIVVGIKPVHSLVSHLTEGLHPTHLLLNSNQSPHHFQLRPSQKRLLSSARLFIYASDSVESFARKLHQDGDLRLIQLESAAGLKLYPLRGLHDHGHSHGHHEENDGHIWLSVENASHMARYLAQQLSDTFPSNRQAYQDRLRSLLAQLEELQQQNRQILKGLQQHHFLVYHDAYQYFEKEYQLQGAHFVTTSPEHAPGIRRVKQLQQLVKQHDIRCVFYEPPNKPALIDVLQEASSGTLQSMPLDPIGSQLAEGKSHYFDLMRKTAQTMVNCLKQSPVNGDT